MTGNTSGCVRFWGWMRVRHRDALSALICARTETWAKADLLSACEGQGVPAGPINSMDEMFADPQVIARGLELDMDGLKGVRPPFRFSGHTLDFTRPAPALGQDDPA